MPGVSGYLKPQASFHLKGSELQNVHSVNFAEQLTTLVYGWKQLWILKLAMLPGVAICASAALWHSVACEQQEQNTTSRLRKNCIQHHVTQVSLPMAFRSDACCFGYHEAALCSTLGVVLDGCRLWHSPKCSAPRQRSEYHPADSCGLHLTR